MSMSENIKRITNKCATCNSELIRLASQVKSETANWFCDIKCKTEYYHIHQAEYECEVCGEKFKASPSHEIYKNRRFCSKKCMGIGTTSILNTRYSEVECSCTFCGNKIMKRKNTFDKWENHYCSKVCYSNHLADTAAPKTLSERIRKLAKMKEWRMAVLEKDGNMCQRCFSTDNLEVHHEIEFYDILKRNNIQTVEDALNCDELWDVDNGLTLCYDHHLAEHPDKSGLFRMRMKQKAA